MIAEVIKIKYNNNNNNSISDIIELAMLIIIK
jgi:hypothetical protein